MYRNDNLGSERIANLALTMLSDYQKKKVLFNKVSDQRKFIEPIIN